MGGLKTITKLLVLTMLIAALTAFTPVTTTQGNRSQAIYTMFVNGQEVGTVKFAGRGLAIYDAALEELLEEYEEEIALEGEVFFRERTSGSQLTDTDDALKAAIQQSVDIKINAYGIIINDRTICYVKTEAEAHEVIAAIQQPYIDEIGSQENHELENVTLRENISFAVEEIFYAQMVDVDNAVQIITVGEEGPREYTVKKGDSLWSIARAFDIQVSDIEAANSELEGESLKIGQQLKIMTVQSLVTVVTKEKYVYTEPIPFTSTTQDDSTIFIGETMVVQQGKDGEKEIELYINKENGRETSREKIGEKIVREPVPQITAKGTKARPAPVVVSRASTNTRLTRPSDVSASSRSGVELTPWSSANKLFPRGSIAKVTHIDTNLVFYVYRHGGSLHADVEPLTAADTDIMRRIYGSFSWARKSIIVEINGKKMAASMNGMPHGNYTITNNNFRGHFCIHFLNSRTHGNNRLDPDHQASLKRVPQ